MNIFNSNFMFQTPNHEDQGDPPYSCTPQDSHVVGSVLGKREPAASISLINTGNNSIDACEDPVINNNHGDDDLSDNDGTQYLGEKKRRLNIEQVKTLEKHFELGNKLEPERKMQLAKTLGLQPRQIAIWFQNRRARWKTKQLEKDYEVLKRQFEAVKAENESLQIQNQRLHAEVMTLKAGDLPTESINLNKDTEVSCSNRSDKSSEMIKLDISTTQRELEGPSLSSTLFPCSAMNNKPNVDDGEAHLVRISSSRIDQNVKEESSLSNIFCAGMDDHTLGFWPWVEQQNFN